METQKFVNLLNGSDKENSKFATKKEYVIDSNSEGNYSPKNPIKFLTSSLESSHRWLVTDGDANTKAALKTVHHIQNVKQK